MTYRRKGHAEHDNQSYVPPGEIERWERENDPLDRYIARAAWSELGVGATELAAIDARVQSEIDAATDEAEASPMPEGRTRWWACMRIRRRSKRCGSERALHRR